MSNLRLINETVSTSDVASISVTDLFTDDFDIYKVVLTELETTGSSVYSQQRFINSSGSVITSSSYDFAFLQQPSYTTFNEQKGTSQTYMRGFTIDSRTIETSAGVVAYIFNPTNASSYTFVLSQSIFYNTGNGTASNKGIAVLKTTEKITGMNFFFSGGNIDGLAIRTYGLRVDS